MRITQLIGGVLVIAGLAMVPAAYAVQGPDDRKQGGTEMRDDSRKQGFDSPRDNEARGGDAARFQKSREDFMKRFDAKRDEWRRGFDERKAALMTKLEQFKDGRKKDVTLRVDGAFEAMNDRWVAFFVETVNRIDNVIDAIDSRAAKAEAAGKDVADVRLKIDAAVTAVAEARTAIEIQASNDYTVDAKGEASVKEDVIAARDELRKDLSALRDDVRAAYDAAKDAAKALRDVPGINEVGITAETKTN